MTRSEKALPVAAMIVAVSLVACLGALHATAQDAPMKPQATGPRDGAPTTETTEAVLALLTQTQVAPPADAAEQPPAEPAMIHMQVDGDVITHLPLQDAPIRLVLRQLAMVSQKNILTSKKVGGNITADLFNVTFREALDGLLRVNGLGYIEEGNFIYVHTLEEMDKMEADARELVTKIFTLYYIKPTDAKDLIGPCLSADGKVATTPEAAAGIATSKSDAGGMDFATNDVLVVSDYEENLAEVGKMLKEADRRPQQVLIEATIMTAKLDEENSLGIDFQAIDGVNLGNVTQLSTGLDGFNFTWGDSNLGVLIDALESITDVNILANPKLLVLNKQRGEIIVGNEDGYFDSTTTSDSGGLSTQSVAYQETGTRLVVRPFIGDNGYIRMEIHPEDSDGAVAADGLPYKSTTECTSNVIVKDGHTIIISGMFREVVSTSRSQAPLLGNIPGVGVLFRHSRDVNDREEMIIMITPRIIKQGADEVVSDQVRDDMERFRMGMRRNLQWWGRGRMAVRHFNWAKEHVANGRTRRAQWDLNMALSLSPAMLEAIQYKEQLTGEAIWANQPRMSSTRWVVQKMVMNDLAENVNIVIPPARPLRPEMLPAPVKDAFGIGRSYDAPIMPEPVPVKVKEAPQAAVSAEPDAAVDAGAAGDEPLASAEAMMPDAPVVAIVE